MVSDNREMNDGNIFELKVKEIIAEQLGLEIEEIADDADILDDLGATSLDAVEIAMAVEETFDLTVSDADILENRNVSDVCDFISEVRGDNADV